MYWWRICEILKLPSCGSVGDFTYVASWKHEAWPQTPICKKPNPTWILWDGTRNISQTSILVNYLEFSAELRWDDPSLMLQASCPIGVIIWKPSVRNLIQDRNENDFVSDEFSWRAGRNERNFYSNENHRCKQNKTNFYEDHVVAYPGQQRTHQLDAAARGWSTVTNFRRTSLQIYLSSPSPLHEVVSLLSIIPRSWWQLPSNRYMSLFSSLFNISFGLNQRPICHQTRNTSSILGRNTHIQ